jgi:hypothetical protein
MTDQEPVYSTREQQEQEPHADTITQRQLDQSPLDDTELETAAGYYTELFAQRAEGPQLEGLSADAVKNALRDPRTIAVELSTKNGNVVWPLLVPIEHNAEYRPDFFENHNGEGSSQHAFYFSDPGEVLQGAKLEGFAAEDSIVVCDYQEGAPDQQARGRLLQLLQDSGVTTEDYLAGLPDEALPRVLHFAASTHLVGVDTDRPENKNFQAVFDGMVESGRAERRPENGATILDPAAIAKNEGDIADNLWEVYQGQFDELIKDHPSMQEQPRESLLAMLGDKGTVTSAYYLDGRVVGFSFFVFDIEACEWLDADYYRKEFPGEQTAYFPGIVVDKSHEGKAFSMPIIRMLSDVAAEANVAPRLVFQCTQVSATYVPAIVELGVNRTEHGRVDEVTPLASYRYEVFTARAAAKQAAGGPAAAA